MPGTIRSMYLEHMLRDVQTDRGSLLHGRLLRWQFRHRHLGTKMPSGGVHPITPSGPPARVPSVRFYPLAIGVCEFYKISPKPHPNLKILPTEGLQQGGPSKAPRAVAGSTPGGRPCPRTHIR